MELIVTNVSQRVFVSHILIRNCKYFFQTLLVKVQRMNLNCLRNVIRLRRKALRILLHEGVDYTESDIFRKVKVSKIEEYKQKVDDNYEM